MKMKRRTAIFAMIGALGLSVLLPSQQASAGPSATEVMTKWADSRKLDGSEAVVKMSIIAKDGAVRDREITMATKLFDGGKTEKRVYKFLAPADVKGTGVLVFDYADKPDDVWIFLPALRKTRRIVSSERSKSFMGSEFSYGDLNIPELDDYTYKELGSETIAGADCFKIEVLPKDAATAKSEGYSKKIFWIEKSNYALRQGLFYDTSGKLQKKLLGSNIKLVDAAKKKYRAMRMEMINEQNGRRSIFETKQVSNAPNTKDEYFTTAYLERP